MWSFRPGPAWQRPNPEGIEFQPASEYDFLSYLANQSPEAMRGSKSVDVEFIRLLFPDPVEEEIAHCWAMRLARLLGGEVLKLRPETTLAEILSWAVAAKVDSMDFVVVFEPELRMDFGLFLDDYEETTFREMVQFYARQSGKWPRSGPPV